MQFYFPVYDQLGVPVIAGLYLFFFYMEGRHQLRDRRMGRIRHVILNFCVSLAAFIVMRGLLLPVMVGAAFWAEGKNWGIMNLFRVSPVLSSLLTFILLDYSNYIWHVISHRIPLIWRFHNVHHTDVDLDLSTAVRFHFGEMIFSVLFRGGAVFFLGAAPLDVLVYEIFFEAGTAFHHSNWKLPFKIEKFLSRFMVTPRMHGIHHSVVPGEMNSNYSVVLNIWDRLHKTLLLNIQQRDVVTGVPSYPGLSVQNVLFLLRLPFAKQHETPGSERVKRGCKGEKTILLP